MLLCVADDDCWSLRCVAVAVAAIFLVLGLILVWGITKVAKNLNANLQANPGFPGNQSIARALRT